MTDLRDFNEELFQDAVIAADAQGIFKEDAFFDIVTEYLIDAGEFDEATRAFYRPERGGVRVDGYCGDPLETSIAQATDQGTLELIILDFNQDTELMVLTNAEMQADFRRLEKFASQSIEPVFRNSLEPTDPGFGLADLINARWEKISRIKLRGDLQRLGYRTHRKSRRIRTRKGKTGSRLQKSPRRTDKNSACEFFEGQKCSISCGGAGA